MHQGSSPSALPVSLGVPLRDLVATGRPNNQPPSKGRPVPDLRMRSRFGEENISLFFSKPRPAIFKARSHFGERCRVGIASSRIWWQRTSRHPLRRVAPCPGRSGRKDRRHGPSPGPSIAGTRARDSAGSLTRQMVLPLTSCALGSMQVTARSPRPLRHGLGQVPHELVFGLQAVVLDAKNLAVVVHADQKVTAVGVEERGDGLERRVGHVLVVLAVLLQVPAQARLELERFRLLELEQLLCSPMPPDVVVKKEVLELCCSIRSRRTPGTSPCALRSICSSGHAWPSALRHSVTDRVVSKNTNELKTSSPGRFGIDVSTLDWPMGARIHRRRVQ